MDTVQRSTNQSLSNELFFPFRVAVGESDRQCWVPGVEKNCLPEGWRGEKSEKEEAARVAATAKCVARVEARVTGK